MPIARAYEDIQSFNSKRKHDDQDRQHGVSHSPDYPWNSTDLTTAAYDEEAERTESLESRQELVARIKRDRRPLWLEPSGGDETPSESYDAEWKDMISLKPSKRLVTAQMSQWPLEVNGNDIQRPRSALHAGDFGAHHESKADGLNPASHRKHGQTDVLSISPPAPWHSSIFPAQKSFDDHVEADHATSPVPSRLRAVSHSSISNTFASRPPTSPLALQLNSMDLEMHGDTSRGRSQSPDKTSRRRTFSPSSLLRFRSNLLGQSLDDSRQPPSLRKHETFPRQAHQPRRSISSLHSFGATQSPASIRSRRQSLYSDSSPLQGAPMVGSYEESILRGRMSTLPSRPLDFVAQIGVLGKGNCKPSLRCPSHLVVPFPAVFYNYGTSQNARNNDPGPSPYVGMIDLVNRPYEKYKTFENSSSYARLGLDTTDATSALEQLPEDVHMAKRARLDNIKKSPKGAYRIPQHGQLQIIIKNPHKTAVKLFLVPYDLTGMEAGQKTFIRQRSYSAGPIIDIPLSARTNLGTDRPEAAITNSDEPADRPVLRYLIHLHICCPSRGRFYLYKSIRVVFANRVPDGKEKLRNEVQLPEPLYTSYKSELDTPTEGGRNNAPSRVAEDPISRKETYLIPFSLPIHTPAHLRNKVTPSTDFIFKRRPLAAAIPEASSHDSLSSGRSSRVARHSSGSDLSPKSTHDPSIDDQISSYADPDTDDRRTSSPTNLSPLRRGHGSGLLALQLRGDPA